MGASVKYLQRDDGSGRLTYRRAFPASLRPNVPGNHSELKRTLGCTDIGDPKCAARYSDACKEYDQLLAFAQKAKAEAFDVPDDPNTAYIVAKFYADLLAEDDARRHRLIPDSEKAGERLEWHQNTVDGCREAKAANDPALAVRMFEDEALALGRAAGLCFDPSTPRFRSLCCLLLDARIEAAEAIVGRDTGSPVSTPSGPTPPATGAAPLLTAAGPTLDRLIEEYTDEKLAGVGRANLISYDPVFRLLRGVLRRDCELSTIGNEQGKAILAAVRALPKNIGKNPQLKGLSVTEAIARGAVLGLPTIEAKTINLGYMAKASALFAWAVGEEYMKTNPVARRKVRDQVAASDKRDPFTMAQLTKLFDQAPWKPRDASGGGNPLRYWGALIALYQGMRLGEIAQLDVGDIEERSGVRMVRIRAGDGKRVKTGNSARALPIHPELERMGFVAYVAAQKGAGASKLFPGQGPNSRGQWGVSFSRWFTRLLGSLEFEGTLLGVHAFRHNFQDALREADLHGKGIGQELAGRSKGGDVSNNYGSGYSTRALTAAMGTIQYPELDLSHLYVS